MSISSIVITAYEIGSVTMAKDRFKTIRFAIPSRLHRRMEGGAEYDLNLLKKIPHGLGQLSSPTAIFTANREYGIPQFIKELSENGYSSRINIDIYS